jgi:uncharacterized protein
MMMQQAEERRTPAVAILEEDVVAYLAAHPDFFERHPDLLVAFEVPHESGRAVSLIERQVALLRSQLETEQRRFAQLIARAQDFETLSARLHALSLQLMVAEDLEQVQTVLRETLCREFKAEAVVLKLFRLGPDAAEDETVSAFLDFLDQAQSLCGPLDAERSDTLFGEKSEDIHSAALIPVRAEGRSGVLAIGSSDPGRFGADMGTNFLDRMGEIVSQKLRALTEVDG